MKPFKYKKAVQALAYFSSKEKTRVMNKIKALKLIWIADRVHLRMYGRPITYDKYYAMEFGPVASSTKDLIEENSFLSAAEKEYRSNYLKSFGLGFFQSKSNFDSSVFSKTDLRVLDLVSKNFQDINQWGLSDFTHNYPEWKKHETALTKKEFSRVEMSFEDFFKNPVDELNHEIFKIDEEILSLSQALFNTSNAASRLD